MGAFSHERLNHSIAYLTEGHLGDISEDCKIFLNAVRGRFTDSVFSAILEKEVRKVK